MCSSLGLYYLHPVMLIIRGTCVAVNTTILSKVGINVLVFYCITRTAICFDVCDHLQVVAYMSDRHY
jgi:hypothetical protein